MVALCTAPVRVIRSTIARREATATNTLCHTRMAIWSGLNRHSVAAATMAAKTRLLGTGSRRRRECTCTHGSWRGFCPTEEATVVAAARNSGIGSRWSARPGGRADGRAGQPEWGATTAGTASPFGIPRVHGILKGTGRRGGAYFDEPLSRSSTAFRSCFPQHASSFVNFGHRLASTTKSPDWKSKIWILNAAHAHNVSHTPALVRAHTHLAICRAACSPARPSRLSRRRSRRAPCVRVRVCLSECT
jgi:hypothetical protein